MKFLKTIQAAAILILVLVSSHIDCQSIEFIKKMTRSDIPNPYTEMSGYQVKIDGDYAVITAVGGGLDGVQSGLAVVYKYNSSTSQWDELKVLAPSVPKVQGRYGWSADIDDDIIVIGQTGLPTFGTNEFDAQGGGVFIYQKDEGGIDNWGEVQYLENPFPPALDLFGWTVGVTNGMLLVGQYVGQSVYIFDQDQGGINNWGLVSSIENSNTSLFGYNIDVEGDLAIISSGSDDEVIIYDRNQGGVNNWGIIKILTPENGANISNPRVAINENIAVVGVENNNKIYVYKKDEGGVDNWGLIQEIVESGEYGVSVAIDDTVVIVGARRSDVNGTNSGEAYIYHMDQNANDTLVEGAVITPSNPRVEDFFGTSVAIQGDQALVGATLLELSGSGGNDEFSLPGRTFVFNKNEGGADNWGETQSIDDTANGGEDRYGGRLDADGDFMIASAERDDVDGVNNSGSAYIYQRNVGGPNNWGEVKMLVSQNPSAGENFGKLIAIQGELAVAAGNSSIHIFGRNVGGTDNWGVVKVIEGSSSAIDLYDDILVVGDGDNNRAFVYQKDNCGIDNWGLVTQLSTPSQSIEFGSSVSIFCNDIIVGDRSSGLFGFNQGAAHYYQKDVGGADNWGFVQSFTGSNPNRFGSRTSIFDDLLVVTSSNGSSAGNEVMYVFEKEENEYVEKKTISLPGSNNLAFGNSVDNTDRYIISSIPELDQAFYIFERNTGGIDNWGLQTTVADPDNQNNDFHGFAVAISGTSVFSSSRISHAFGYNSGTVFHHELSSVPFITQWDIDTNDEVTIPIQTGDYNFDYKWTLLSDPSVQISGTHTNADGDFTTTFVDQGTYSLEISGRFPHFKGYPAAKLVDVTQWGNMVWSSMNESFKDWEGSSFSAVDIPDLSRVIDFTSIFEGAINFTGDISDWKVGNVQKMKKAFSGAENFNVDISNWSMCNITNLDSTFQGALTFNQDISQWITKEVTSMNSTFDNAQVFNQDISGWDVSLVTDMTALFEDAAAFNQPIGNWDVSSSLSFDRMFMNAVAMDQYLGDWRFQQTAAVDDVFTNATGFTCESWSPTIIGWHLNNLKITNFAIGGPATDYDSQAASIRLDLVDKGWVINGTEVNNVCSQLTGKYWTGIADSDWDNANNWLPKVVPTTGDNLSILEASNQPIIDITTAEVRTIEIEDNASLTVATLGELRLDASVGATELDAIVFSNKNGQVTNNGLINIQNADIAINFSGQSNQLTNQGHITIDDSEIGIYIKDKELTFANLDSISITQTRTGVMHDVSNSLVTNDGFIYVESAFTGVNLNVSKADFTNNGNIILDDCSRGIRFRSDSTNDRPTLINNSNISINNSIINSLVRIDEGGNFLNNQCATLTVSNSFGNIRGSIINHGLINNLALSYGHTGVYVDNGFQYDPYDIIPDDNTTTLAIAYNQDYFNEDLDGDDTTLCEGDAPDDIFRTFRTTWSIEAGQPIEITHSPGNTYSYLYCLTEVDNTGQIICGEVSPEDQSLLLEPLNAGTYELNIIGQFPAMQTYDRDLLDDVIQWGDIKWQTMNSMFQQWPGIGFTATDAPDLSQANDMAEMFDECILFDEDLNHWNVSTVQFMESMFDSCLVFNSNISDWNVGNVTTVQNMFRGATLFNQDIGNWDVTAATDMGNMLANTAAFNQDLSDWSFNLNVDLDTIFGGATGMDCTNWSKTIIDWNLNHPDLSNQNITNGNTMFEHGIQATEFITELVARGWTIFSTESSNADCSDTSIKFWTGNIDTDWEKPGNWSSNEIPIVGDQVIIPSRTNDPILQTVTPLILSLEIRTGATMSIEGTGNLNLED